MPGFELHTLPHLSLIPSLGVRIIINCILHTGKQSLGEWTRLAQVKTASGGHSWDLNLHLPSKCVHVFILGSVSCESNQAPEFGERVVRVTLGIHPHQWAPLPFPEPASSDHTHVLGCRQDTNDGCPRAGKGLEKQSPRPA